MEIRNCRGCGKLFNYIGGVSLCAACKEEVELKFQQVKQYIESNKNALISQIAEDNDVSLQQIRQWIREERLVFSDDSVIGIECESCGKTIKTGRFCDACKNDMAHKFGKVYEKKPEEISDEKNKEKLEKLRMRFLEHR